MDCAKTGQLIKKLRTESNLTQKQLADKMNLSDKTISKWERGTGCPDVSLLPELSEIFKVRVEDILNGSLSENGIVGGNMKKSKFYICEKCGNITLCTGDATVSCCGRKLDPIEPKKASDEQKLKVEQIENDWYITSSYPMTKDNFISFVAFLAGDRVQIIKQYPEWDMQVRFQKRYHGKLIWYSTKDGMFYQLI